VSFFYFSDETTADGTLPSDVAVIGAGGEIDYSASPQLKERINASLKSGARCLVLDLFSATFIDSTAIGVIVGAANRLKDSGGGPLEIVCVNENVLEIFKLTGLEAMVTMHSSRGEALSALAVAG
jgi:anti-sigma B factor antagonist